MRYRHNFGYLNRTLIVVMSALITLCAVSSCSSKSSAVEYKDSEFLSDVALGWQERYDIETQAAVKESAEEQQELLMEGCETELSYIEKYQNEEFKKQSLKDLVSEYITCINEGKDALQYYSSDNDKYLSLTRSINNNRRRILTRLVSDYGMSVDEEHQDAFSEFLSNAQTSGVYSKQQDAVNDLVAGIVFEEDTDDYYGGDYHTYSANVENTTSINFEDLRIKVKLYDSEGVAVDTENVNLEGFKAGSTEKAEFTTDADFEKMEVSCGSWKEAK